ncbi:helicase SRCAP-like [Strigops habroptila]|uniref:helicase SRCAP-like n=1 Tax=Strigops habroptila TaxID=2489341 RepID=UPI0011CFFBD1|nr:helicase SRCAP-like [Strigops habroptila]
MGGGEECVNSREILPRPQRRRAGSLARSALATPPPPARPPARPVPSGRPRAAAILPPGPSLGTAFPERPPRATDTVEVECEEEEEGPAHTGGSGERRLGRPGAQELDQGSARPRPPAQDEAPPAQHGPGAPPRGLPPPHPPLHPQVPAGRMTGSSPVSPASSGSPGSVSPPASSPAGPPRPDGPPGPPDPPSLWDKTHAEIAEQAKHEAEVEHRVAEMKREGFWSLRRLPKVPEPPRPKVHWDYLCEEMQWLAADFAQERRWKRGVARKVVRMVMRHHEEQRQKEERAKREEQAKLRRVAAAIAKEVKQFWSNVEKPV